MPNATAIAAAAAVAKSKKLRQLTNENAAKHFAAGVAGLIALFALSHWIHTLYRKYGRTKQGTSAILRIPVAISRLSRSILIRKTPGFPTIGHNLIWILYITIQLPIAFTNINWSTLTQISKRLGWITMCNLCVVLFLSIKNTPLAPLTAQSYERLQPLHQIAGYTLIISMILHSTVYINSVYPPFPPQSPATNTTPKFNNDHTLHDLLDIDQICGIIAGLSLLLITPLYFLLRKRAYEVFYIVHVALAILIVVCAVMHRPDLITHSSIGIIIIASLWGLDRLVRYLRVIYYSISNAATLTALPHGGTRVLIKKAPAGTKVGMHVFVHLRSVRGWEMHPFTVVSRDERGLELVVAAMDGFTGDLHKRAIEGKEVVVKASVEGPYGCLPDLRSADKVVFVSGGSGGSFSFGVAAEFVKTIPEGVLVDFVWVIRHKEMISWYATQLATLASSPKVSLRIYLTSPTSSTASLSETPSPVSSDPEKPLPTFPDKHVPSTQDLEKATPPTATSTYESYTLHHGRPDIHSLISNAVSSTEKSGRVEVVTCGPRGMMREVRRCVAGEIKVEGPGVGLWCEDFGW